jgi:hypothetical protein
MSNENGGGSVENEAYCMPSMQQKNVDDTNTKMGYHKMSDLANTKPWPVSMSGERRNMQEGAVMSSPDNND